MFLTSLSFINRRIVLLTKINFEGEDPFELDRALFKTFKDS